MIVNQENNQVCVHIETDADIVLARQLTRELAKTVGFSSSELAGIAAAISELARNILTYAKQGVIKANVFEEKKKKGVIIVAEDEGPGLDVERCMQDGYSTSNSLGLGLPGVKRLMDMFEIHSINGKGTIVTAKKWVL
jgi:serine/threonine-protein kinase RsbT